VPHVHVIYPAWLHLDHDADGDCADAALDASGGVNRA
jgi:hypothetical protein